MNIKNLLIGVVGIGMLAVSASSFASVTIEIDGQDFLVPFDIQYDASLAPRRVLLRSRYGWLDADAQNACTAEITDSAMEVRVLGPNDQALLFPVTATSFDTSTKTLKITTQNGGGAHCMTEVFFRDRFEG